MDGVAFTAEQPKQLLIKWRDIIWILAETAVLSYDRLRFCIHSVDEQGEDDWS